MNTLYSDKTSSHSIRLPSPPDSIKQPAEIVYIKNSRHGTLENDINVSASALISNGHANRKTEDHEYVEFASD